jgi:hypothetical protein
VRLKSSRWAAFALAAPGCLLAAASIIVLTLAAFGRDLLWPHETYNLAEAAAVREEAEVVRLIEQGHDPNIRYPIRPSLVFNHSTRLTPLEAAVVRDDPAIFRQLIAKGALMDAAVWTSLRCTMSGPDMFAVLDEYRPDSAPQSCDGSNAPHARDGDQPSSPDHN